MYFKHINRSSKIK